MSFIGKMPFNGTLFLAAGLALSGCVTTGSGPGGTLTELEKANNRCVASVFAGAALGAVIGNNVGNGNAGDGALVGAGAGLLVCAVIREAAREQDAVIAYQRAAVANGQSEDSWVSASGQKMHMRTEIIEDDGSEEVQTTCRYSASTVQVEGLGSSPLPRQRWCRSVDGSWAMA